VAAHLDPEILIVDEVLAVGDAEFQRKCLGKMNDAAHSGRTILFVSHNMAGVESLCSRVIWLQRGSVAADEPAHEAITRYRADVFRLGNRTGHRFVPVNDRPASTSNDFTIHELRITSAGRVQESGYALGAPLQFELEGSCTKPLVGPVFMFSIRTASGQLVTDLHSLRAGAGFPTQLSGRFVITCSVPDLHLMPGDYDVSVAVKERAMWFFSCEAAGTLTVHPADFFGTGQPPVESSACIVCHQQWHIASGKTDL
jgi:lipopolysaccharide transport system ATP-binding protein